jgi:hypothetical protein
MSERAVAPVVGKVLEVGVVLAYAALVTGVLVGGVAPDYRTAAGDELADRALAEAATAVTESVPRAGQRVTVERSFALPDRIRGEAYVVRATDRRLVLDHPHGDVGASQRLALPARVVEVRGSVRSTAAAVVTVESTDGGLVVEVTAR